MEFVKNEGGCAYGYIHDFVKQEWYNQKQLQTHYFHMFSWPYFPQVYPSWVVLKPDPYLAIYSLKFMHMEQAGLMARISSQWKSFKPMEPEKLEPLKMVHLYVTMIGIVCGLFLALVVFIAEKFRSDKSKKNVVCS